MPPTGLGLTVGRSNAAHGSTSTGGESAVSARRADRAHCTPCPFSSSGGSGCRPTPGRQAGRAGCCRTPCAISAPAVDRPATTRPMSSTPSSCWPSTCAKRRSARRPDFDVGPTVPAAVSSPHDRGAGPWRGIWPRASATGSPPPTVWVASSSGSRPRGVHAHERDGRHSLGSPCAPKPPPAGPPCPPGCEPRADPSGDRRSVPVAASRPPRWSTAGPIAGRGLVRRSASPLNSVRSRGLRRGDCTPRELAG